MIPDVGHLLADGQETVPAYLLSETGDQPTASVLLKLPALSEEERRIIKAGCLMNYYRDQQQA